MIRINAQSLDEWLENYEDFNREFRDFCYAHFKVHSIRADFVPNVTEQIHAQWVKDNGEWLREEMEPITTHLSHVKICALLLYNLNAEPFLANFCEYEYQEDDRYIFTGSAEQKECAKRDLVDCRETVLSLDFCITVIDWFERNRTDRAIPYRQPMTPDMRHDILAYLLGGGVDRKGLYLILKAMYLRPSGGGSAN